MADVTPPLAPCPPQRTIFHSDRKGEGQPARRHVFWARASALAGLVAAAAPALAATADLSREVQAIFARHCHECHGPEKQKGDLRLDDRSPRLTSGDAAVIIPGRAAESELYRRITLPHDDEDVMPNRGQPLTKAQIEIVRAWIAAGAPWPENTAPVKHWSYVGPERPAVPAVSNPAWPKNPIDAFILARLDKEGLQPSVETDRARLLRRVSLDLTGLPPSPRDVEAFVSDRAPDAYEKVVDRLLASPRYGERWARPWLDLARYADSYGFQRDDLWEVWPYRDWVIRAFNDDLPFDQFTIQQLAGDLLPNATLDQKVATGFSRCGPINMETGSDQEETRVNQVFDRVNTMSTVWLGSTLECAQCHNHKYDPFQQKDYYQLFAFFNNTPQETAFSTPKATAQLRFLGPELTLPDEKTDAERATWQERMQEVEAKMQAARTELLVGQAKWEETFREEIAAAPQTHPLDVTEFEAESGSAFKVLDDKSVQILHNENAAVPAKDSYTLTLRTKLAGISAFKLEVLPESALPGAEEDGPSPKKLDFVLTDLSVRMTPAALAADALPLRLHNARANASQRFHPASGAIDADPMSGWSVNPGTNEAPWIIVETETPLGTEEGTTFFVTLRQLYGEARTIGRLRFSAITGQANGRSIPADIVAIAGRPAEKRTAAQKTKLADYYLTTFPVWTKLKTERTTIENALKRLQPPRTLAMQELDQPRMTAMFARGNFMEKGEPVQPGVPEFLHPLPPGPRNRLTLAQWLVSRENPLVARVTVNRWWGEFFGRGLVSTPEDFGLKGEPPTHPELLDWLAVEFMDRGWSMKQVHRLIVTSATYRQSSNVSPELWKKDDRNLLYARGPRFRMEAEMIRDNALAVAGLLSDKLGGPPVRPYQPPGLWDSKVGGLRVSYNISEGEDRHRRGLYTVWKRTSPYPSFINFDATNRTACTVTRPRSNTPLQALTLLNDPVYVEAALALAKRVLTEKPAANPEERIRHAFQLCVAREPGERAVQALLRLYQQQLESSRTQGPPAGKQFHDFPKPPGVDPAEFAAWQSVAAAVLNLDETITKG